MKFLALGFFIAAAASATDFDNARQGLAEFNRVCDRAGRDLWGVSLCGPMILVNPGTHEALFSKAGNITTGKLPEDILIANTSVHYDGADWAMVRLPLPTDPYARLSLLAHESFHRTQDQLHLSGSDQPSAQFETESGRLWFRLELRAEAAALRGSDAAAKDAMLFRLERYRLFPTAEATESGLEIREGLAEYTGVKTALSATNEVISRTAREVEDGEDRTSLARGFVYSTGPALGLLLDRYSPGWRSHVTILSVMLCRALRVTAAPGNTVIARARIYGYDAVAGAEQERAVRHAEMVSEIERRFVTGPYLQFPTVPELNRSFNPSTLVAVPPNGTYYPTGEFSANWGKLSVDSGALLSNDNRSLRVSVPSDPAARPLNGDGWTLILNKGWTVRQGSKGYEITPDE
ncbi:hypothetical protein [Nevskia soli]|jgi:hypothetical protein|uniref:hypothetical protein n=1 Tax=Nevskia soli TaxID=418856 RepID=UPI0015D86367|nr:hypothetical protein [Nevskia soli]